MIINYFDGSNPNSLENKTKQFGLWTWSFQQNIPETDLNMGLMQFEDHWQREFCTECAEEVCNIANSKRIKISTTCKNRIKR